jgi:hypothetical protein
MRHLSPALLSLFLVLNVSCSRKHNKQQSITLTGSTSSAAITQAPAPSASSTAVAPQASAVDISQLGFDSVPPMPKPSAVESNSRGMAYYKRHNIEEALKQFEKAVATSPEFTIARYNAAAMKALLSRNEESASVLRLLLAKDLPRFFPRVLTDPDFATFRTSTTGAALVEEMNTLRVSWLRAAQQGIPMVALVDPEILTSSEGIIRKYDQSPWVRVGVWIAQHARFLPLLPAIEQTLGGVVDVEHGRGMVVSGRINRCQTDYCPRIDSFRLTQFDELLPRTRPGAVVPEEEFAVVPHSVEVESALDGPRWRLNEYTKPGWYEVVSGSQQEARKQQALSQDQLVAGVLGTRLKHLPEGWHHTRNELELPDGRKVRLSSRHAGADLQVVELADRKNALCVTVHSGCACNDKEQAVLEYLIELLDLQALTLTRWDSGPGSAAVRVSADHAIYLQRAKRVERLEGVTGSVKGEALPTGFFLTPPMVPDDNCCGL